MTRIARAKEEGKVSSSVVSWRVSPKAGSRADWKNRDYDSSRRGGVWLTLVVVEDGPAEQFAVMGRCFGSSRACVAYWMS